MGFFKVSRLAFVVGAISLSGFVYAGPQVIVNFKNNTSGPVSYNRGSNRNEVSTYSNASPKPNAEVRAGASDIYTVRAAGASPITYATVRYKAGSKSCQFTTSYMVNSTRGGVRTPKWNKSVVAGGGAKCDVHITSTNFSTHDWAVDFLMK